MSKNKKHHGYKMSAVEEELMGQIECLRAELAETQGELKKEKARREEACKEVDRLDKVAHSREVQWMQCSRKANAFILALLELLPWYKKAIHKSGLRKLYCDYVAALHSLTYDKIEIEISFE